MSGGSYNYIYSQLNDECSGRMHDAELNDMIEDMCELLRKLEWWQSGDSGEGKYREAVSKFKAKWFNGTREERLKGYIDDNIKTMRTELYQMIGINETEEKDSD